MRTILILLLAIHGAIHLLGFAKGVGLAEIAELRQPIGTLGGVVWLAAALLLLGAAVALWAGMGWWWVPALGGILVSQGLILGSWDDARFGTVANLVLLIPVGLAALDARPSSLRSTYEREAERLIRQADPTPPVLTADDLAHLPEPVRVHLERIGVVGRPRVVGFQATFEARIRGGPDEPWMEGRAEQVEVFGPPERLFFMEARRAGLPIHVLHRYGAEGATMEARLLGLFPVMRASGPEMTRSESVTLLNDVFFLAPAALVDLPIDWEVLDPRRVRATFTHCGYTVSAVVRFDDRGDLVHFESRDRYQMDRDPPQISRWSTPLVDHRDFDGIRLPAGGEARWGEPGEEWTYVELELNTLRYDVGTRER